MGANELTGSAIAAYVCAEIIEWAKHHPKVALLQIDAAKMNRVISILIAGLVSLGIHSSFDAQSGTWTVTGLLGGSILAHAGEWFRQWAFQNMLYKAVVKPNAEAS